MKRFLCLWLMLLLIVSNISGCSDTKSITKKEEHQETNKVDEVNDEVGDVNEVEEEETNFYLHQYITQLHWENLDKVDLPVEENWCGDPYIYLNGKRLTLPMKVKDFLELSGYTFWLEGGDQSNGNGRLTEVTKQTYHATFTLLRDVPDEEKLNYPSLEVDILNPYEVDITAEEGFIASVKCLSDDLFEEMISGKEYDFDTVPNFSYINSSLENKTDTSKEYVSAFYGDYYENDYSENSFSLGMGELRGTSDMGRQSINVRSSDYKIYQISTNILLKPEWNITTDYHGIRDKYGE